MTTGQKIERTIDRRQEESRKLAAFDDLVAACEAALFRCEEAKRVFAARFIGDDELIDQLRAALAKVRP